MNGSLRLRPLRPADEREVHAAQRTMLADRFTFAFDLADDTDWPEYLAEHERRRRGIDVPAERVPASFLVATLDGAIVGRASIRHELNAELLEFGGHIGYCVLPPFRRGGLGIGTVPRKIMQA